MQDGTDDGSKPPTDDGEDTYRAVIADLVSLIEHIQASLKRIDAAVAAEAAATVPEMAADVVLLDDVTPRYLKAGAALLACDVGLGVALHLLREPMAFEAGIYGSSGGAMSVVS